MRAEVVEAKLDSLARCLLRIDSKKPFSPEDLAKDFDLQDIVSINLERAVQSCVDLASICISEANAPTPATMADSFTLLAQVGWLDPKVANRMAKAVGFRNIAVHEYEKMDWNIVHKIAHEHLADFRAFAQEIGTRAGLAKNS
jgi:uncharacterized protein YutE (UPF0331/DUF86 family)